MTRVTTPQGICRFGIAHGDITPPEGIYHRMWGASSHDRATGVHRPLRTTVGVFGDADSPFEKRDERQILVALDHCVLGVVELDRLLDRLEADTNIERSEFLVVCSHTHAAGLMSLDRVDLPGGDLIPDYLDTVAEVTSRCVLEAIERQRDATLVYGTGRCDLAAHRDFWDENSGQFVCGYNPDGAADDTVVVARIWADGETVATIVNYACHPTSLAWGNTLVSPDYPGAMREVIESATGAPCLFLQGASGDLGPREGYSGDPEVADRNGRQLGYSALAALESLPPPNTSFDYLGPVVSGATLGAWGHVATPSDGMTRHRQWCVRRWMVELPYREDLPTSEKVRTELADLTEAEEAARTAGDEDRAHELRALAERRRRLLHRIEHLPPGRFSLRIVLWKIGNLVWVGVQGEHFQILRRALCERFPDAALVVATIAFDWRASYLVPHDLYGSGIYQETVAVLAPGSLERVIESIGDAIEELLEP